MTRTLRLSLIGLALAYGLSLGAADALAQPRPALPAPPPPSTPPVPPAPSVGYSGDFDFNIDWDVDLSGLGDSIQEKVRAGMEAARQKANDFKASIEHSREEAWYRQARESIDREQYERALSRLDQIIASIGNRLADAAMYWKAYSLGRLDRRAAALNVLAEMQKRFPDSRWLKDAKALEVETRQASGQAVSPDAQNDEELKLLALRGLMRTDPARAMPMIEKLMAGNGSMRLREKALFVLSQSQAPKAREIISAVARSGNPDLQARAIRYLGVMNGDTKQNQAALTEIYRSSNDTAVKRSVIDALSGRSSAKALADLARTEKDPALKRLIVSRLSTISSPDATDYLLELLK